MTKAPGLSPRRPLVRPPLAALATGVLVVLAGCTTAANAGSSHTSTTARHHPPAAPSVAGQPAPSASTGLAGVSCADTLHCWAVGSPAPIPGSAPASSSGGTTTLAGSAGALVDVTTDGGKRWRTQNTPVVSGVVLSGISCPDVRHCLAVGDVAAPSGTVGLVLATSNGGRKWHQMTAPSGAVDLVGLVCAAAGQCQVLATAGTNFYVASTADGGNTWQSLGTLPSGFTGATSMTCPAPGTCLVAGYTPAAPGHGVGTIAVTTDNGDQWALATLPAGSGFLHDVSCSDALQCMAVGTAASTVSDVTEGAGSVFVSSDGGSTWVAAAVPAGLDDAFAVSCPAAGVCAAVGTTWAGATPPTPQAGVITTADSGDSWVTPKVHYVPFGLDAVDCPTATSCVGVGGSSLATIPLPTATSSTTSTTSRKH